MRILITGATGFIGSALCSYLTMRGHEVIALSRGKRPPQIPLDAVVHLAGETIASRWSAPQMRSIFTSRIKGTQQLIESLSVLPKVFISASAVGYYGNRGEELLSETSSPGKSFLSHVCMEWEKTAQLLQEKGVRSVQARFGLVLGGGGGMMKKILPLYKLGLGAVLGNGQQWMSWISLADLVHAIDYLLLHEEMEGPVNIASPYPVRQEEFSRTLATLLHRPLWFKIPGWVLSLLMGRSAEDILLASTRARPAKLLDSGFSFRYPHLLDALKACLK